MWGFGLWLIHISPHWSLWIPAALVAGLGGWGLHCIAHDCGHGSFSSSRRLDYTLGHIALLPMLYPFHGWRHVHNLHHANTNSLEKDTDWRPVGRAMYERMPLKDRAIYLGTRSLFFWLGTAHYQIISGFSTDIFPNQGARADVRRSLVFVLLAAVVAFPAVFHIAGPIGLVKYILLPWCGMHAWFSATTLLHHTAADVPFLDSKHWTKNASRLLLTTDYRYSRFLHFFTHNITVHAAHHVAPKIPFYNLPAAQEALKEAYPGMVREKPFNWRDLYVAVTRCHLYDFHTGLYTSFSGEAEPVVAAAGAGGAAEADGRPSE
jgi:omega-6 fatty acid desaturase (delta-12 desaturase)